MLGSFVRITGVDANGCAAHGSEPMPAVARVAVRLCRYGIDDWLEQSELLYRPGRRRRGRGPGGGAAKGDRMCTMALTGPGSW